MSEREIKLEAPPSLALPDLSELGLKGRPLGPKILDAVYYDTQDLRLARWGCSLRWRSDEGWMVKLPESSDGSDPWLQRIERTFHGERNSPPPEALDLLRAYLRDEPVRIVARLKTRRHATEILSEGDETLAELDDDEVSVLDGRRIALRFRELEVELRPGVADDVMEPLVERLREQGAAKPSREPKIVRAVGPRALEDPEVVVTGGKPGSVTDVLRDALSSAVLRVIRHDAGIRMDDGEPEHVHQARVGIRRFRTILKEFKHLFDDEWNQALRKEAKALADALGDVRDADVLIARQQQHVDALVVDERAAALATVNHLHAERDAARDRLLAALRDPGYARLLDDMVAAAREPRITADAEASADSLLEFAVKAFKKLKEKVGDLDGEPSASDLHRVRILTKRARYVAEAVTPVAGKDASRFAKQASELQDILGELQDATVAGDWLRGFSEATPQAAFIAGKIAGLELVAGRTARSQWRKAWDRLDRKRMTAWLTG